MDNFLLFAVNFPQWFLLVLSISILLWLIRELNSRVDKLEEKLDDCLNEKKKNVVDVPERE